jgi:hypothetical protein
MSDTEYEKQLEKDIDILRGTYYDPPNDPEYIDIAVDDEGNVIIEEQ